jgi:hypothetical protein
LEFEGIDDLHEYHCELHFDVLICRSLAIRQAGSERCFNIAIPTRMTLPVLQPVVRSCGNSPRQAWPRGRRDFLQSASVRTIRLQQPRKAKLLFN